MADARTALGSGAGRAMTAAAGRRHRQWSDAEEGSGWWDTSSDPGIKVCYTNLPCINFAM